MNTFLKQYFGSSNFPWKKITKICDLGDIEGLKVSYNLSWSGRAKSMPVFSARIGWGGGGIMCYIQPYISRFMVMLYFLYGVSSSSIPSITPWAYV